MRIEFKILILTFLSFTYNSICKSQIDKFDLTGVWAIELYKSQRICAMDDSTAVQWIGKKAFINDKIFFEYSKIPKYSELFKKDINCNYKTGLKTEIVSTNKYFDECFRESPEYFGINQKEVLIIHTNCTDTPFSDIICLSNNQIVINWDGILFFLKRQ